MRYIYIHLESLGYIMIDWASEVLSQYRAPGGGQDGPAAGTFGEAQGPSAKAGPEVFWGVGLLIFQKKKAAIFFRVVWWNILNNHFFWVATLRVLQKGDVSAVVES